MRTAIRHKRVSGPTLLLSLFSLFLPSCESGPERKTSIERGFFCTDADGDLSCESKKFSLTEKVPEERSIVFDEGGKMREYCLTTCSAENLYYQFHLRRTGFEARKLSPREVAVLHTFLSEGAQIIEERLRDRGFENASLYASYAVLELFRTFRNDVRFKKEVLSVEGSSSGTAFLISILKNVSPEALAEIAYHTRETLDRVRMSPASLDEEVLFLDSLSRGTAVFATALFTEDMRVYGRGVQMVGFELGGKRYLYFNEGETSELGSYSVFDGGVEIMTRWGEIYRITGVSRGRGELLVGTILYNLLGFEGYVKMRRYFTEPERFTVRIPVTLYYIDVNILSSPEPYLISPEWKVGFEKFVEEVKKKGIPVLPLGERFSWEEETLYRGERPVGRAWVEEIKGKKYLLIDTPLLPYLFVYGEKDGQVWAGYWRKEKQKGDRFGISYADFEEMLSLLKENEG